MADHDDHGAGVHLPPPSALPLATSVGIALILGGLVPDARIWRLALVSIGITIVTIFGAQWARAAIAEYNNLPE
jgi:hypothetical protein